MRTRELLAVTFFMGGFDGPDSRLFNHAVLVDTQSFVLKMFGVLLIKSPWLGGLFTGVTQLCAVWDFSGAFRMLDSCGGRGWVCAPRRR